MNSLFLLPLGLLQAGPTTWPSAVLFILSWVKIGGFAWGANAILRVARGPGEIGEKLPDFILPGLVVVGVILPDTLTRLLGFGQSNGLLTALSAWQLIP